METNSNRDMNPQDESHEVNKLAGSELENSTQKIAGDGDEIDDINDIRSHSNHERHGNRKYESFTNHSSAADQPGTTTDTNLGRDSR